MAARGALFLGSCYFVFFIFNLELNSAIEDLSRDLARLGFKDVSKSVVRSARISWTLRAIMNAYAFGSDASKGGLLASVWPATAIPVLLQTLPFA